MAKTGTAMNEQRPPRPSAVVAYVSALAMFSVMGWTIFYQPELFPYSLLGLPVLALLMGLLAVSVWNGSRIGWCLNVLTWTGVLSNSLNGLSVSTDMPLDLAGLPEFNYQLLRLTGAAILLAILVWPSFFEWVWRRGSQQNLSPPAKVTSLSL
jgi:hypothetical protein